MRFGILSCCGILLATAVLIDLAAAHPPAGYDHESAANSDAIRTWTLAEGGFHVHGSFVALRDGKVQIHCDDGTLISLAVDRLVESNQKWIASRQAEIRQLNSTTRVMQIAQQEAGPTARQSDSKAAPAMAQHFQSFADQVKLRWDPNYLYVESNGMPDHPMMIGITAWQQQVPLPQAYSGANAWRIPLHRMPARQPLSAKEHFFRGAIALAVNGVPIFNPIKNDGKTDTLLAGELDEYGGHCGRGDDYHYHIAPVHLQKTVGKRQPIAYALDGYPIYGYDESDESKVVGLDWLNGHKDADGHYHYHATKNYPYLNGGFYGEVVERDGQVHPQPQAGGLRPALPPLRGAKITDFASPKPDSYRLTYELNGKQGTVTYTLAADGSVKFTFVEPNGKTTSETYMPRSRGGNRQPPPRPGERPPVHEDDRPIRSNDPAVERREPIASPQSRTNRPQLLVSSSSLDAKGKLSIDCTCDGAGMSPAVAWKNAPEGTKFFALSLWHIAPDQEKSYWVVYNIPATVTQLAKNAKGVGKLGVNDKRRTEYDPMCSKGPGVKTYHITVFALSAEVNLSPVQATRANLASAIKDITLAEGTLDFQYERKGR